MNNRSPRQEQSVFCVPCQGSGCFRAVHSHIWGFIPATPQQSEGLQWEDQGKAPWKSWPSLAPAAPTQLPQPRVLQQLWGQSLHPLLNPRDVCAVPARAHTPALSQGDPVALRDRDCSSKSRTNSLLLISPTSSRPVSLLHTSRHE